MVDDGVELTLLGALGQAGADRVPKTTGDRVRQLRDLVDAARELEDQLGSRPAD